MPHRERALRRLIRVSTPVVLSVLIINGVVGYFNLRELGVARQSVANTLEILASIEELGALMKDAQASVRGFLITALDEYLEPYQLAQSRLEPAIFSLRNRISDNPLQVSRLDEFLQVEQDVVARWERLIKTRRTRSLEVTREQFLSDIMKPRMDRLRALVREMSVEEQRLLKQRDEIADSRQRFATLSVILGSVIGTALVGTTLLFFRREAQERQRVNALLATSNEELERRVAERTTALNISNRDLHRSNQELERFASVASHDLQEPLRKIQAFADRLRDKFGGELGEQGSDYINRLQNASARMRRLIDDLLTFSRVTTKARPFETVDLNSVVSEVLSDLEERVLDTQGDVQVERLPRLAADPLQMRQLFQNLISNALKFHRPDTPPRIQITSKKVTRLPEELAALPGVSYCEIVVSDNGIGFEEIYVDRIFEVFQRLHGRNEFEGTGIGLAICRRIAERHRGMLVAKSQVGEGSRFTIILPLEQPEERGLS